MTTVESETVTRPATTRAPRKRAKAAPPARPSRNGSHGAASFDGPSAADQAEIWAIPSRVVEAWAEHNADAFAGVFTEGGTMILPGLYRQGREDIRLYMKAAFADAYKGTRVTGQPINIVFLGPDAVLLITQGGVLNPGESKVSDIRAIRASWLVVRHDGQWQLAAYQNSPSGV